MALDAFGRLRTSENFTTFNYYPSPLSNNTTLDIDVFVSRQNGGTQTYDSQNFINMPISGSGDTYSLRTTKQPMIYQPGKSRLIFMTGVLMATIPPTAPTTSRMGIFSVDSATPPVVTAGTYLKCNGINLFWEDVTQTGTTTVIQSSWNIDTFDGTGPSGKTLTIANAAETLLLVIDQEWLGIGRIRCGFIIDGVIYYGHQFLHNGFTVQYTKTPRLNLSYYISGTTANSMRQMCCTNIIEGGYFTTGRINNISVPLANFVTTNSTQDMVILGIRVNSAYPDATFFLNNLSFYYTGGASKYAQYKIQLFSTTASGSIGVLSAATPTFTSLSNSAVQYYYGTGGLHVDTPGFIIGSGYVDVSTTINIALSDVDSLQTRQLFTKYDTLYITGIATNTPGTMGASVSFVEDI
jgi:hypothetical protein